MLPVDGEHTTAPERLLPQPQRDAGLQLLHVQSGTVCWVTVAIDYRWIVVRTGLVVKSDGNMNQVD